MIIWIDAHLSPAIAAFINRNFTNVEAKSVRSLSLREAKDSEIFFRAKAESAIIMSKDADFLYLVETFGIPLQIIWITSGNTTNANMCKILQNALNQALQMINAGETIVEISDTSY